MMDWNNLKHALQTKSIVGVFALYLIIKRQSQVVGAMQKEMNVSLDIVNAILGQIGKSKVNISISFSSLPASSPTNSE